MAKPKSSPKKTTKRPSQPTASKSSSAAAAIVMPEPAVPTGTPSLLQRLRPKRRPRPAVPLAKLPSVWRIAKKSVLVLWANKKIFIGLAAMYALLNFVLVRGFSGATNIAELKDVISGTFPGATGQLGTGLALFALLITTRGSGSSDVASLMQFFLVMIVSLAIVWLLRQVMSGERPRIRDGFYRGMYPLVPVLLVLLVVFLQLLPFIIGGSIYSIVVGNNIAVTGFEILVWTLFFFATTLLTLYWLSSSIIALYIATLPDMTPLKALRSARDLVRFRRWAMLRKLLFLPLALIVVTAAIMLPVILLATIAAPYVFFALSMLGIIVVHSYLYTLYRELLA